MSKQQSSPSTMSQSPSAPAAETSPQAQGNAPPLKAHSCVLCAQRKVKCDKRFPCGNCVKARVECIAGVLAKPRRRKKRLGGPSEVTEDLITRLRRYERMLIAYGATREDLGPPLPTEVVAPKPIVIKKLDDSRQSAPPPDGETKTNMDPILWVSLSDEILEGSSEDGDYMSPSPQDALPDGGSMLFSVAPSYLDLNTFHPEPVQVAKLWQVFLDNINPLTKFFHTPTLQQHVLGAANNLSAVSKDLNALMFCIYVITLSSISNEECFAIMGEDKITLLARYQTIAQQALMQANLLKTTNLMVLQALLLFLQSVRHDYDLQALWVMTGVAVRIAQRFGMHSERKLAKCSVFEAEIRRRLWWEIIIIESRSSEIVGSGTTLQGNDCDTAVPRDLNDADLYPTMTELPQKQPGATEMIFCSMRHAVGEFIRKSDIQGATSGWSMLIRPDIPLAEKEKIVKSLEDMLMEKFLEDINPLIPLHLLTYGVAQSILCRLRLMCRHPRQFADRGASMTQQDKDELFDICMTMIGWDNKGHTTPSIQGYHWHINFHFQPDAFIWCLSEIRHSPVGGRANEAWPQLLEVYDSHPNMLLETTNALYVAIGSLTLKSWAAREDAFARNGKSPPEGAPPRAIAVLRSQRMSLTHRSSISSHVPREPLSTYAGSTSSGGGMDISSLRVPMDNSNGSQMGMDNSPVDWAYWNELIQGSELAMPEAMDEGLYYDQPWALT